MSFTDSSASRDLLAGDASALAAQLSDVASSLARLLSPVLELLGGLCSSTQLRWNGGYLLFIMWLYFFHAPLKDKQRTDRYAQVTKVVQIWSGVHITVFHLMGTFLENFHGRSADVTKLFFPMLVISVGAFSLLHKLKRLLRMRLTYAPTILMLSLNSLLVALTTTAHVTYCFHLEIKFIVCPAPVSSSSTPTVLLHLFLVAAAFVCVDFVYKSCHRHDPLRGILWAAEVFDKLPATRDLETDAADGAEFPTDTEGMVSWYSMVTSLTALQLFVKSSLSFLAFDFRGVEEAITPKIFRMRQWTPGSVSGGGEYGSDSNTATSTGARQVSNAGKADGGVSAAAAAAAAAVAFGQRSHFRKSQREDEPSSSSFSRQGTQHSTTQKDETVDFVFDFVADVGDGYNSTYAVARALAQPEITVNVSASRSKRLRAFVEAKVSAFRRLRSAARRPQLVTPSTPQSASGTGANRLQLPRGQLLLVGGDLCYPHPTEDGYRRRLFRPYDDALPKFSATRRSFNEYVQPDPLDDDVAYVETAAQRDCVAFRQTEGNVGLPPPPAAYFLSGNHDSIDGGQTFRSMILSKGWIGGWIMPQESTYFVIELPGDWTLFCLDTGLNEDINPSQMQYFLNFIDNRLSATGSVIMLHHEPMWIHDAHYRPDSTEVTMERTNKVARRLGNRLRMRLAGDIHNYSRYKPERCDVDAPMLVVSGGGGAFMHGIHNFTKLNYLGAPYIRTAAFPGKASIGDMLQRVFGFRVVNWQFDLFGGLLYFVFVASMLPLPPLGVLANGAAIEQFPTSLTAFVSLLAFRSGALLQFIFTDSYISLSAVIAVFAAFAMAVESKVPVLARLLYSAFWTTLHVTAAVALLVTLDAAARYMTASGLVASTAAVWNSALQLRVSEAFWAVTNELQEIEWISGAVTFARAAVIEPVSASFVGDGARLALKCVDAVEALAHLTERVSSTQVGVWAAGASRLDCILYIVHLLAFFWVLATPVASLLVGLWIVCSIAVFQVGYDAAYAAFQIEDYKNFVRLWLTTDKGTGQVVCNCFAIGIERVPKAWKRTEKTGAEVEADNGRPAYCQKQPSRWASWRRRVPEAHLTGGTDPVLIDQFTIFPTPVASSST